MLSTIKNNPYVSETALKNNESVKTKKEPETENVNLTKVERIKKEIEEGTYKINLSKTVELIVDELM